MGVMWTMVLSVGGISAAVLVAALGRIVADEVKEWTPTLVGKLIARAVRRLPESERARMAEEWASHVEETPGTVVKIVASFGFLRASKRIARGARQRELEGSTRKLVKAVEFALANPRDLFVSFVFIPKSQLFPQVEVDVTWLGRLSLTSTQYIAGAFHRLQVFQDWNFGVMVGLRHYLVDGRRIPIRRHHLTFRKNMQKDEFPACRR